MATLVSEDVYAKVPATLAVGAVIVVAASPRVAPTLPKFVRVGAVRAVPVTFIAKLFDAHVPLSDVHEDPEFELENAACVGDGVTSVVTALELHFHPIVLPALPATTMKYLLLGSRLTGEESVRIELSSPHAPRP